MDGMIETCLAESVRLLGRNSTEAGVLAATPSKEAEERRYTRVFGRDAAICALGMAMVDDPQLRQSARASLLLLAQHQAENGQIPKYVDPSGAEADFWYLGCIDATLWWLIALKFFARHAKDAELELLVQPNVQRALTWLRCQEHPRLYLLQQNEASDWADIMPRSGFVLYTNALWYAVKRLYGMSYQEETKFHFNHLFYPFSRDIPDYRRLRLLMHYVRNRGQHSELYLSFVNFSFWGDEGDIFGNLLAVLFGLADEGPSNRILRAIEATGAAEVFPIRVTNTPIGRDHVMWRPYMGRHKQNLDYQYHNGGIWPYVGGFWAMALTSTGQYEKAEEVLHELARASEVGDWGFYEWFHGETGEPNGMRGQSWNAALFVLAEAMLRQRTRSDDFFF